MKNKTNYGLKFMLVLIILSFFTACTSLKPHQSYKMPPPEVLDDENYNPFLDNDRLEDPDKITMLYATNRIPAGPDDKEAYYLNERSELVRLGSTELTVAGELNWSDLTSIEANREEYKKTIIEVSSVDDFGILDSTLSPLSLEKDIDSEAREHFVQELRDQLAKSEQKDVFIFVHGYNVNFESPLLMASQFWHYMGYSGAFISYSWPSTPRASAYMKDLDTAAMSSRGFRLFLDFLAEQDEVERIHILAYSAGTRLVTQTLYQKALQLGNLADREAQLITKLGTVLIAGSDMDRSLFASYIMDGQLSILERLDLYTSHKDMVLQGSRTLHNTPRLGQTLSEEGMSQAVREYIMMSDKLQIIDVSQAESVTSSGGHAYIHESPWVISDLLLNLRTGRSAKYRGLIHDQDLPIWIFPNDYIDRTRTIISGMKEEQAIP